ncbi:MAG: tetratricopeptide repeat protein, partial [Bacteroidetes bacterium]|nr:tetratricopeptide repeat protein [Bacteroidota bacterium]
MKRLCLLLTCSLLAIGFAFCQTATILLDSTNGLIAAGSYGQAEKILNRIAFFGNSEQKAEADYQCGQIQFLRENFYEADHFFRKAYEKTDNPSLREVTALSIVQTLIGQENYNMALEQIRTYENSGQSFCGQPDFYSGLCYYMMEEFDTAAILFAKIIGNDSLGISLLNTEILRAKKSVKKCKPQLASIFSVFVPGMGQFAFGQKGDAIISLMVNAIWGGLLYSTATVYTVFDAIVSIGPWAFRYY